MEEIATTPAAEVTDNVQQTETQTEETAQPVTQKYKVRVDSNEMEVDLDELIKGYQLSTASKKRFDEAAEIRNTVNRLLNEARQDPSVLFKLIEADPSEYARKILTEQLEWELLSDEEKAAKKRDREFELTKKELEELKRAKENETKTQRVKQQETQLENEILSAIQETGIKPVPRIILKTAEIMALDEKISAKDALVRAKHYFKTDIEDLVNNASVEDFMKLVKPETQKKLRQYFINQAQASGKPPTLKTPAVPKPGSAQAKKPKMVSLDDLLSR